MKTTEKYTRFIQDQIDYCEHQAEQEEKGEEMFTDFHRNCYEIMKQMPIKFNLVKRSLQDLHYLGEIQHQGVKTSFLKIKNSFYGDNFITYLVEEFSEYDLSSL